MTKTQKQNNQKASFSNNLKLPAFWGKMERMITKTMFSVYCSINSYPKS